MFQRKQGKMVAKLIILPLLFSQVSLMPMFYNNYNYQKVQPEVRYQDLNKQAPSSSWWPLYDHTTQRSPPTYPPRPQRYPLPYPPQSIPKSSPQYHLPNTPRSLSPHIPTPTPHIPTYNVVPTFHPSLAKVQQKGKSRSPTISPSYKAFPSVYTTQSKVQPADNSNSASPEITQPPPYPSTTPVTTDYTMLHL